MIEVFFAILLGAACAAAVLFITIGFAEEIYSSVIIGLSILLFFVTWTYLYATVKKEYDPPVKFKIVETDTCQFALYKDECINLNERFGRKFNMDEVELVKPKAKYYYGIKPSNYSWGLHNEF